jgi:acyl-coenzyme A synthetase/AMP-(fatty) acid ligase/rubrerythrin
MLCPKCQRPLEDESAGVYICCAGASLQWRCSQCAKVSEGFALPYGRCPHCGGKLMALEARRVNSATALDGIRTAFEVELGGRAFYQRAAAEAADPALEQVFSRFALMEGEHMETLSRRYHVDVPLPSPSFRREVAAIFAEVEDRPQDPDNLFRIAIGLEKRAASFFGERATRAPEGSAEQALYRELAAEELEHASLLASEQERRRRGKPGWFDAVAPGAAPLHPKAAPATTANAAWLLLSAGDPRRDSLRCGAVSLSYGELREQVARTAAFWRATGIQPGDRIAIKLPDGIDWVTAFLGALWAGAVAVPVNPRVPAAEWQYILDEAGFKRILAEAGDDTPAPWCERIVQVDAFRQGARASAPVEATAVDPRSPAFWCHSSGTSGKPKAVVHAHTFARRIEQVSSEGLGIHADDRLFASSKLFFAYPQTNSLWAGLKLGATVIVDPQWPTPASVAAAVAAQRPTVLFSVPSLYRNLLHDGLAPGIAQAGVRLCVSAGEALPPSLRDEWRRQTGLVIVNGYGASETLILVMLDRGDGTGFAPSPGVDIQPLEQVAPGQPSRLRIRAPTLALGYLDRPQAQAESFRDGEFCPADLFARDVSAGPPPVDSTSTESRFALPNSRGPVTAAGWRFAGREDSLVKIHGRWVNLVELEERLTAKTPGLKEGAAVLVPDADGMDAVAFFFAAGDDAAVRAALQARADALPPFQRPRWWHAVPTLPRGPTGKLLRRKLRELHTEMGLVA